LKRKIFFQASVCGA